MSKTEKAVFFNYSDFISKAPKIMVNSRRNRNKLTTDCAADATMIKNFIDFIAFKQCFQNENIPEDTFLTAE